MDNNIDINWYALGIRIKEVRKRKGYSVESLSIKIDKTSNFLSRVENNLAHPSLSTIYRIAIELDCGIDYLLSDSLLQLSNSQLLNLNTLNATEQNYILDVIRGLKKCEAEIISQFST